MVSRANDLSRMAVGIKLQMFPKRLHPKMEIFSVFGMAGLGKTTLVKKLFEDPEILHHFDHHAWITLGPNYRSEEILVDILNKIYIHIDKVHLKEDEKLVKDLCSQLSNTKCLIVLDDLWNKEPLHYLQQLLPDIKGEIFVTTRLFEVAKCGSCDFVHNMPLLDEEQSWLLFCRKLFANEFCPIKLEKAGKKISKKCEGLPLLILTVADLLSKAEMSAEYWEEVAEKKNSSVFMEAHAQISNVLSPSYDYSPQHLKVCFLYMGAFSQGQEIRTSRLINMWAAEGFLEPNPSQTVKDFAVECLSQLVDRSLVMACQKRFKAKAKSFRLHSVFWHLSNREAAKSKFFLAPAMNAHNSIESFKGHRRLCIRHGILFSIKELQNAMMSIPTLHSLLYTGPHHQYPVPICLSSRLLRVLDALMIRFYEFPVEVVTLIQLTYLALTCNGDLPGSISKLQKLQCLIVNRHLSIKSSEHSSSLPAEVWNMKELNHLQIVGGCLRNPSCGNLSPKLSTLLEVDSRSCTKKVLKRIPKLKKLGIQIELAPDGNNGESFRCLNRISRLRRLESLKCVVVNPELTTDEVVPPPVPRSMFPSGLKKLSLSGLGYPWEYMSIIGKLQNLEVLKLRCYAFQGPRWETNYLGFKKLKYLLIEDTDLVCWTVPSLLNLDFLSMKNCFNFEELPVHNISAKMIEVDDCNTFVMSWAKQMKENRLFTSYGMLARKTQINCSWDDGIFK